VSIRADLMRKRKLYAEDGSEPSMFKLFLSDGTSANVLYRAMRWSARSRILPLAFAFQLLNKWMNQCVIGINADFGPGLVLVHPVGVVINSKVRGGNGVIIESSVVIGDEKGLSPQLGNDVFVGSGAKIIGGVVVGAGARVGANAVVVTDIPENSTAVGIPARVVRQR
jgi:serine O-acetyltransferase